MRPGIRHAPHRDAFMHRFWMGCTATIAWARRCRAERRARRELFDLYDAMVKQAAMKDAMVKALAGSGSRRDRRPRQD